jgi:hypothetical protein
MYSLILSLELQRQAMNMLCIILVYITLILDLCVPMYVLSFQKSAQTAIISTTQATRPIPIPPFLWTRDRRGGCFGCV